MGPLLAQGSQGQEVEHPLVAMLRLPDVLCDKLALPLRKAHAGPQPTAVMKPYRGAKRITRKLEAIPAAKT